MIDAARGRVRELLADRATGGLGEAEAAELDVLLVENPQLCELDDDSFDLAAAAAGIVMNGGGEALPAALRRRVVADRVAATRRSVRR